jgi:hypothetical protein
VPGLSWAGALQEQLTGQGRPDEGIVFIRQTKALANYGI